MSYQNLKNTQSTKVNQKVEIDRSAKKKIKNEIINTTEEQLVYSRILNLGRKIGLFGIVAAFGIYILQLLQPKIPLDVLPKYWDLSSSEFAKVVGLKNGWSWLTMYNHGDMLVYFGIAALCLVSIACYIAIIPSLLRKKDFTYATIAILEVLILVLAASGLLKVGE